MNLINYFNMFFAQAGIILPREELVRFAGLFKVQVYDKNDIIVKAGETKAFMGFILKGLVRFYFTHPNGKEYNQTFYAENSFIMNYYPAFVGKATPFNVSAIEYAEILVGDYTEFEKFYDINPIWDRAVRLLVTHHYMVKTERELQFLLFDAKERYENFMKTKPDLADRLSQYQIAMYLGINPSSLNRILKHNDNTLAC
jgi:CRP-like cAMP-binding protein